MNKALKLFKLNFKNNKKTFIIFIIFSVIVYALTFMLATFSVKAALGMGNIEYKAIIYNILESITLLNFAAISISAIIFSLYMIITLYTRFNNADGTLYTRITLPVKRSSHILSLVLEGLIFIAIQFVLINVLLRLNYYYILRELRQIDNASLYSVLEHFSNKRNYAVYLADFPVLSLNVLNIVYDFLITFPIIILSYIFIYQFLFKYKSLAIVIIAAIFALSILMSIRDMNYSFFYFINKVSDTIFRRDFNTGITTHNIKLLSANIFAFAVASGVNCYIFKKKLDF